MKPITLFVASLLATVVALPTAARAENLQLNQNAFMGGPGPGPGFGPGFGHGPGPGFGPGFGHGPEGPRPGPGWDHDGPRPGWGWGHDEGHDWGHGWDHGPRWGNPGWVPPPPPPPPPPCPPRFNPPPPPPPSYGLCQGNFSGSLANGDAIYMSINGNGQYVTASVSGSDPGESYVAQGTCFESNGVAQLSLRIPNGATATAQVYLASDGVTYLDGTQNSDGQRFILQRQ